MSDKNVSETRKDSGSSSEVFYEQLQSEYNKLLKRYAEAENTIDELRTGAKIRLYSDPQDVQRPVSRGSLEHVTRYSQKVHSPRALYASVNSAGHDTGMRTAGDEDLSSLDRKHPSGESLANKPEQHDFIERRIQMLKNNVDSLESCLAENDINPATLHEISKISHQLRGDHSTLNDDVKSYSHPPTPSGEKLNRSFSKSELGKELHRMDLRLQDIQHNITGKLNANRAHLKPNKTTENSQDKPKSQEDSSIDTGLAHLINKLKDLNDVSKRREQDDARLNRSHDDSLMSDARPYPRQRAHHISSEGDDVVDARYLTPSPVYLQRDHDKISRQRSDVSDDQFTYEASSCPPGQHYNAGSHHGPHLTYPDGNSHHGPHLTNPDASSRHVAHLTNHGGSSHPNHHTLGTSQDFASSCQSHTKEPISVYGQRSYSNEENLTDRVPGLGEPPRSHGNQPCDVTDTSPYKHDPDKDNDGNAKDHKNCVHKSNSMSDVAGSSRMSTPLFYPRGSTRVAGDGTRVDATHKQRRIKYQQAGRSCNGFDSGFVGSEESRSSRMTAVESPQMLHKLNLSNHWDSILRLDLSEIDENNSVSSHEQPPRTHGAASKSSRRSPSSANISPRDGTEASTLLNSSHSPPSSPDRAGGSVRHVGYKRPARRSLPVPRMQLSDPPLSRISERQSSERSSHAERTLGTNWDNVGEHHRTGSREVHARDDRRHKPRRKSRESSEGKTRDSLERDTVVELHHDITGLRHQLDNVLGQSRVVRDVYDHFRREDEEVRHTLSREHERQFDELRRSIEGLRQELHARTRRDRRHSASKSDEDDVRNEIKKLSERLQDLSDLRQSICQDTTPSPSAVAAPLTRDFSTADNLSSLVQRVDTIRLDVDHLRSRIENEAKHDVNGGIRCRLCDDVTTCDHNDHRLISPHVTSHVYQSPRQSAMKTQTVPNLSWSYPGVHANSPVVHHVHTYHGTPAVKSENDTDSSSDESSKPRRTKRPYRPRRRLYQRHQIRRKPIRNRGGSSAVLDEAHHAAQDVQRLSKTILNKISLDLASFRT